MTLHQLCCIKHSFNQSALINLLLNYFLLVFNIHCCKPRRLYDRWWAPREREKDCNRRAVDHALVQPFCIFNHITLVASSSDWVSIFYFSHLYSFACARLLAFSPHECSRALLYTFYAAAAAANELLNACAYVNWLREIVFFSSSFLYACFECVCVWV